MARRKTQVVEYTCDGETRERLKRTRTFGTIAMLKSGKCRVFYTLDGKRYASHAFDDKTDAERYRAELEAQRRAGTIKPPATIEAERFSEYARTWVEQHRTSKGKALAPRTKAENLRMLGHGLSYFNAYSLTAINSPLVRKWHALRCRNAGATTAGNEARVLKAILATAVRDEVLERNPVPSELTRSQTGRPHRAPTVDELSRIIDHLEGQWRVAVYVAAFAGLRAGELSALERRDISFMDDHVNVHVTKQAQYVDGTWIVKPPKSSEGVRDINLPEWLTPVFTEYLAGHVGEFPKSLLFTTSRGNGYVSTATWGRVLHKAMKDAGVTAAIHWHDLRHFFGSALAENGAGIKQIQAALGHSTARASLTYLETVHGLSADLADRLPVPEARHNVVPFNRKAVA